MTNEDKIELLKKLYRETYDCDPPRYITDLITIVWENCQTPEDCEELWTMGQYTKRV